MADQHVWPHWRDALRQLYAHEKGKGYSNGGGAGGKKAEHEDFRRLRRALRGNAELSEDELEDLCKVAFGILKVTGDKRLDALRKRVERRLRVLRLIKEASTVTETRHTTFQPLPAESGEDPGGPMRTMSIVK